MATDKLINKRLGKKIKFALNVKKVNNKQDTNEKTEEDDEYIEIRTLKELKENFDIESVVECFLDRNRNYKNGECKLSEWLEDRYYNAAASEIRKLNQEYLKNNDIDDDTNNKEIVRKIYEVFEIEPNEEKINEIDFAKIKKLDEKAEDVGQLTDNKTILSHISQVARNQAELEELSRAIINQTKNRNNSIYLLPSSNNEDSYYTINEADLEKIRYVGSIDKKGNLSKIKILNQNGEYMKVEEARELKKANNH